MRGDPTSLRPLHPREAPIPNSLGLVTFCMHWARKGCKVWVVRVPGFTKFFCGKWGKRAMAEPGSKWRKLSVGDLQRERALIRAKARQLRAIVRQQQRTSSETVDPDQGQQIAQLRNQIEGLTVAAGILQNIGEARRRPRAKSSPVSSGASESS